MTDLATLHRYNDFTHASYARFLAQAKENYIFRSFDRFDRNEAFILWRHDVDASMHASVTLARIEAAAGVQATYFLLPGCEHYNLFEPAIIDCMKEIRDLGHHFGLHFHITPESSLSQDHFVSALTYQRDLLAHYCDRPITAFSYHNPDAFALSLDADMYGDMVNTYARYFRDEVAYCSDSNGVWRHASLGETLHAHHPRLQVLTHPEWWTETPLSPRARIYRCIGGRARSILSHYNHERSINHRLNVCELGDVFERFALLLGDDALTIEMLWLSGDHALALLAAWRLAQARGLSDSTLHALALQALRGEPIDQHLLEDGMRRIASGLSD